MRLFVWFDDLHVMVIEQIPGGVIDLRHGQLEIDLGLNETQLGLGQLGLGVQNEEYRLGAQLVLAFVSMKSFAGKVRGDSCGFHRKLGLFERMHGVGHFERDALISPAFLVLVAAAADQGIGKIGLCGVSPHREGEGKRSAVSREGEKKSLTETIAEVGAAR